MNASERTLERIDLKPQRAVISSLRGAAGGRGAARRRAGTARRTPRPDVNKRECRSQFQPDRPCADPVED
ncbi:hypothetical protein E5288_WYG009469 [Bos mutus]|uniref:Uncharacterized protein n=1 Tax=Bos mutus TaxID=72004 RepID=A0A6B0SES2_9CETA|nr:hypothetical protein [Bos mutus]